MTNKILQKILNNELKKQQNHINLIASENYVSEDILETAGSIFTNKYCEGYPKRRYYGGCKEADEIEQLAIDKAKEIFNAKFANVQPHSGTQANIAAYLAILKPNDKILAMGLNEGGHLSHGASVSATGKFYKTFHYGVDRQTHQLDYEEIFKIAKKFKPNLIVCGASNYSRKIDFEKFYKIANDVKAYLLADIAHISGLIVANYHMNPLPYADIVTTTTHKTLRGPRSGLILTNNEELAKKINSAVFPGIQGGPLMHIIAAKYACFNEASKPTFKKYIKNVIDNTLEMVNTFKSLGYKVIADGSDNHLLSLDVFKSKNITGDYAEKWLESAGIIVNKNLIPYDTNSPKSPSGIRIGSAAMTTRGFTKKEFKQVVIWIHKILDHKGNQKIINDIKKQISVMVQKFPIYNNIKY